MGKALREGEREGGREREGDAELGNGSCEGACRRGGKNMHHLDEWCEVGGWVSATSRPHRVRFRHLLLVNCHADSQPGAISRGR